MSNLAKTKQKKWQERNNSFLVSWKLMNYLLNGRGEVGFELKLDLEDVPRPPRVNNPGFGSMGIWGKQGKLWMKEFLLKFLCLDPSHMLSSFYLKWWEYSVHTISPGFEALRPSTVLAGMFISSLLLSSLSLLRDAIKVVMNRFQWSKADAHAGTKLYIVSLEISHRHFNIVTNQVITTNKINRV